MSGAVFKSPVIVLTPENGNRRKVYNLPSGVQSLDVTSTTTADLTKVRVSFDGGEYIELSELVPSEIKTQPSRLFIEWDPSEDGKTIQFLLGREYYRRAIRYVKIIRSWDIAPKLDVISALLTGLTASDYNIISLGLSIARTDVLIAQNVIFLKVLESTTSTALYTIKLFDPSKPGISQSILPPGSTIERLRRANIYLSNPVQPSGTRLDILVFMG